MSDYENESGELMSCSTLKPRKRPSKRLTSFLRVYDEETNDIRCLWLSNSYALNCPILRTCRECGRCKVFQDD